MILANISFNAGEPDKAIALYKAALEDFNEPFYRGQIWNGLGYAYETKNDLSKAAEYFESTAAGANEILKGEALFNLGRIYSALGNNEKSLGAYQRVITDHPDSLYADLARERTGGSKSVPAISTSPKE